MAYARPYAPTDDEIRNPAFSNGVLDRLEHTIFGSGNCTTCCRMGPLARVCMCGPAARTGGPSGVVPFCVRIQGELYQVNPVMVAQLLAPWSRKLDRRPGNVNDLTISPLVLCPLSIKGGFHIIREEDIDGAFSPSMEHERTLWRSIFIDGNYAQLRRPPQQAAFMEAVGRMRTVDGWAIADIMQMVPDSYMPEPRPGMGWIG